MAGWGAIYNNVTFALRSQAAELARLQEQAASGVRVVRASDDPANAYRILQLRGQGRSVASYRGNIDGVVRNLEQAYNVLSKVSANLTQALTSTTQVASSTYTQDSRLIRAAEIDSLLEDTCMWANSQHLGQHLFSGATVKTEPYVAEYAGDRITSVRYQGSPSDLSVPVAPGVENSGVFVGDRVFRSDDHGQAVFVGDTGTAAGAGTSSVRGDVWLIVTHGTTTYNDGGATGVASGTNTASDTIVGAGHSMVIDGDAKTIRLGDGQAVSYADAATPSDLRVQNDVGDTVYVDVSGIDPGLTGTVSVPITATARLSIDDGASSVEVTDFTVTNLTVTDSRNGHVLFVDPSEMSRTGTELVRMSGTYDVFGTLITIRDLLRNDHGLPEPQQVELLHGATESLEEMIAGITQTRTGVGGRMQAMDSLGERLQDFEVTLSDQAAVLENADIVDVATQLARVQTFYEMTLATASKLLSLSLLDFI